MRNRFTENKETVVAGKHTLEVTEFGNGRYVVRTERGFALTLGGTKEYKDRLIADVSAGVFNEYIDRGNAILDSESKQLAPFPYTQLNQMK